MSCNFQEVTILQNFHSFHIYIIKFTLKMSVGSLCAGLLKREKMIVQGTKGVTVGIKEIHQGNVSFSSKIHSLRLLSNIFLLYPLPISPSSSSQTSSHFPILTSYLVL